VNSDEEEEGKCCCSMLLMLSLRLCQMLSPLQNACVARQRQAKAAGKQTSALQQSSVTQSNGHCLKVTGLEHWLAKSL